MTTDARPRPPSVDRLLTILAARGTEVSEPAALTALVREVLADERRRLAAGGLAVPDDDLAEAVLDRLERLGDPDLTMPPHVINATGVIVHTNLGRAPWPRAARLAAIAAARSYGYLELDEATGRRGPRYRQAEDHLVGLTGAEDALIVTNNAAALALAVGLAGRRGAVVVSRGELVEIGGGVRIPDVIARAGVRLVEVGTTNRTRAEDFEAPLRDGTARVVLRVHPSNFAISGFTEAADLADVAAIAHRHGAIVIDDLGSGALLDTADFGLVHEPTPAERLAAGADVVLFSGDKLVGGPQAGLVVGRADLVARLRRDPLARAVRPDKAILAGVAATLAIYRAGRAALDIPVWHMIGLDAEELRRRAEWIAGIASAAPGGPRSTVVALRSAVGGGSLPGQTLPSFGVSLAVASPAGAAASLRAGPDRILARIVDDAIVFDLRTVPPVHDGTVARRIGELSGGRRGSRKATRSPAPPAEVS
ncbi:MAG TPA: L-seryl-tRNA(Sec) selenium transferase [Candidatus Limnocylindrales bacterium]|nr:L-seryl-tRNA(Sec) selenium transferase [Candidatus Limnocylindrales bacterium]